MTWWKEVDEVRILIAPDSGASERSLGNMVQLRHPRSGNQTGYLLINGMLQELHWYKQSYGSWFLGDYVCEDGSLYMATPIDPVFIMLPIFEEARMKKGNDSGMFRQLDEIIFVDGYPGYQQLLSMAENCMQVVCEIKEVGSIKFFRLDDSKVVSWLNYKVCQLKQTLPSLDQNYAARNEKDTLADAVSIVGEYLTEPCLKLLCDHLKLDLPEAARKAEMEALRSSKDSNLVASNPIQEKKTTARSVKPTKKAKPETESRNIRDMFSRACKRASK